MRRRTPILKISFFCFIVGFIVGVVSAGSYYKNKIEKSARKVYEGFEDSYDEFGEKTEAINEKTAEEMDRLDSIKTKSRKKYEDIKSTAQGIIDAIAEDLKK